MLKSDRFCRRIGAMFASGAMLAMVAACGSPLPRETDTGPADTAASPVENELSPAGSSTIPAAFHGVYDRSAESCHSPSEYRLVVSGDEMRFHESVGRVRDVAVEDSGTIRVFADFEGEGESWTADHRLRLGNGGNTLAVTGNGTSTERVRCRGREAPSAGPRWDSAASGEGDGLSLLSANGERRLTLFCPSGTRELLVNVPAFRAVGSEERMSFGSGGTVVALVADVRGDRQRGGVTGRGPVPTELEAILAGSEGISVNYGAQNSGPHDRPSVELARSFLAGCSD